MVTICETVPAAAEKTHFLRGRRAVSQLHRDIAAQQALALVAQAAQEGGRKAFDAADRRRTQSQTEKEDAKAAQAAAQLAAGKE